MNNFPKASLWTYFNYLLILSGWLVIGLISPAIVPAFRSAFESIHLFWLILVCKTDGITCYHISPKPISLETKCLGFFFCLHVYIYSGHLLCIRVVNWTRYERQKGQLNLTFQSKDVHVKTIQLCQKKFYDYFSLHYVIFKILKSPGLLKYSKKVQLHHR